jgi:hypothetical protein
MESEVRVIETPGFDTDYWLCRCEGFEVETPEGRLGIVEWLVFDSRHDRPDTFAVRTGHVRHRSVLVAVSDVVNVLPEERRITLAANPAPMRSLRSRLAFGTSNKPSSASLTP